MKPWVRKGHTPRLLPRGVSAGALVLAVALFGCRVARVSQAQGSAGRGTTCAVFFSPRGGCTEEVVRELRRAQRSVLVQAYSFTSEPIAQALIEAHRRGVDVEVILDKSQLSERRSLVGLLARAKVPVRVDDAHAIAHNKIMVIDGHTVITGSFNFTQSAEARNAENLLVVRDDAVAAKYRDNWQAHEHHSGRYAAQAE